MEFCFAGSLRRILLAGARCSSSVKTGLHGSSVYLSNISKSGDRGPRKNFNKKMKKNLKKTTEVDVTDLVSSLKTFEERGRIQAREQNEQEDENLKYAYGCYRSDFVHIQYLIEITTLHYCKIFND